MQESITSTPFGQICLLILAGAALHLVFLAINFVAARFVLRLPPREFKAVLIMGSQKTLPVSVTIISYFPPAFGTQGLLTLPCIVGHMVQLFIDAVIVSRMAAAEESQLQADKDAVRPCRVACALWRAGIADPQRAAQCGLRIFGVLCVLCWRPGRAVLHAQAPDNNCAASEAAQPGTRHSNGTSRNGVQDERSGSSAVESGTAASAVESETVAAPMLNGGGVTDGIPVRQRRSIDGDADARDGANGATDVHI